MKMSTKGRYGLKAMLDLAVHCSEGYISLKSIAERLDISENYLEQLFARLKKNGLVKSARGSLGGYSLTLSPNEITVGAVLRALEGSLAPVDCVKEQQLICCERTENCVTRYIWEKIRNGINQVVDSITLGNLVEEYKKLNSRDDYTFYI